jgi:hypothetical protein
VGEVLAREAYVDRSGSKCFAEGTAGPTPIVARAGLAASSHVRLFSGSVWHGNKLSISYLVGRFRLRAS